jgi:hypothetical protein
LKKAPRADIKGQVKEFFRNSGTSTDKFVVSLDNIGSTSVVEEIKRINGYLLLFKNMNERFQRYAKIFYH